MVACKVRRSAASAIEEELDVNRLYKERVILVFGHAACVKRDDYDGLSNAIIPLGAWVVVDSISAKGEVIGSAESAAMAWRNAYINMQAQKLVRRLSPDQAVSRVKRNVTDIRRGRAALASEILDIIDEAELNGTNDKRMHGLQRIRRACESVKRETE